MVINYQGKSYFKISSGEKLILINPEDQRSMKNALFVLNTIYFPSKKDAEGETPFTINHQGEYDIQNIKVDGKFLEKDGEAEKTSYSILFEEMKLGIIPPFKKEPDIENLEILEDCDILFFPLSNKKEFLNVSKIVNLLRQLEPRIIVPYFPEGEEDLKDFLRELGKEASPQDKLTIKKKEIVGLDMEVKWIKSK
jgi:hypothetical protein